LTAGPAFHKTEEEEAFDRWRDTQFLDLERQTASKWRKNLSGVDFTAIYNAFQRYYPKGKPKELSQVKSFAERVIDEGDHERSLSFGLMLLGYTEDSRTVIVQRYHNAGKPPLRDFAPYFHFVYSVELFFNLAIAADLISKERPSNKIDLAYLYYLPFCQIFTSNDNLHEKVVPLFLRDNQRREDCPSYIPREQRYRAGRWKRQPRRRELCVNHGRQQEPQRQKRFSSKEASRRTE
jgi:hypothetical protein